MFIVLFSVSRNVCNNSYHFPLSSSPSPSDNNHDHITRNIFLINYIIKIVLLDIPKIHILLFSSIILNYLCLLQLSTNVNYVTFNTDLTVCRTKRKPVFVSPRIPIYFSLILLSTIVIEYPENLQVFWVVFPIPNYGRIINLILKFHKTLHF